MFYHIKLPQKYVILLPTQNASCKSYICTKVHSYQSLNIDISKIFNIIFFVSFFFQYLIRHCCMCQQITRSVHFAFSGSSPLTNA